MVLTMYGCLTLPLYSSMITLPAGPSIADYASTLRNIPGYRVISSTGRDNDDTTVYLGSRPRFAFLGTLASANYPAPVSVHLTSGNVVTATVSPRHFPALTLPNTKLRDYQVHTAVHVRDALATVAPEAPVAVTRVAATKAETLRGYAALGGFFTLGYLLMRAVLYGWNFATVTTAVFAGALFVGLFALLFSYRKTPARPVEGFQLI